MMRYLVFLLIAVAGTPPSFLPTEIRAATQAEPDSIRAPRQSPLRGMVWEAPAYRIRAEEDLRQMHRAGVEAIRAGIIRDHGLLRLADTLGVSLYIDLPISRITSRRLNDTLDYASAVLDTVLGLAQIHPSIRHIGLARHIDSSDSTACSYFRNLAERARRSGPSGTQVYYLTRFVASDRCAETVDLVLGDVRDRDDPVAPLRRWNTAAESRSTPLGIGSLGWWVRNDTLSGLRVPSSPEAQARSFERYLPILFSDTLSVSLPAVFVFRWRDIQRQVLTSTRDLETPFTERYGLHARENIERPAKEVVEGIYTGRRETFAFRSGRTLQNHAPLTTFFGWGVILLLALFYALTPRFRHMVPRYFSAHFFYRDAVREGRDVLFGASTVLLIALGAAFGLTLSVILNVLRESQALVVAVAWLPRSMQDVVITLLADSWVLIVLAGCAYAVGIILWTIVLSLVSKRGYRISSGQSLMLVLWPRWPLLLVMAASMVLGSSSTTSSQAVLILAAGWGLASALAAIRTIVDFVLVTRVPIPFTLPCLLFNPGVVVTLVILFLLLPFGPEGRYLWHLATRA